jgi:excisionase family DNA binding protein
VGEAARALGVSDEHFARYIAPELRWVRLGSVKLVAREELEAWLRARGRRTLEIEEEP